MKMLGGICWVVFVGNFYPVVINAATLNQWLHANTRMHMFTRLHEMLLYISYISQTLRYAGTQINNSCTFPPSSCKLLLYGFPYHDYRILMHGRAENSFLIGMSPTLPWAFCFMFKECIHGGLCGLKDNNTVAIKWHHLSVRYWVGAVVA